MPHIEVSDLRQRAVLWRWTGDYGTDGQPSITASPVEIGVRWSGKRAERLAKDGTTITLDATAIVAVDVPDHSRMWLGNLNQWYGHGTGSGSSGDDSGLMYVKMTDDPRDIKNRSRRRTVGMIRLHDLH